MNPPMSRNFSGGFIHESAQLKTDIQFKKAKRSTKFEFKASNRTKY